MFYLFNGPYFFKVANLSTKIINSKKYLFDHTIGASLKLGVCSLTLGFCSLTLMPLISHADQEDEQRFVTQAYHSDDSYRKQEFKVVPYHSDSTSNAIVPPPIAPPNSVENEISTEPPIIAPQINTPTNDQIIDQMNTQIAVPIIEYNSVQNPNPEILSNSAMPTPPPLLNSEIAPRPNGKPSSAMTFAQFSGKAPEDLTVKDYYQPTMPVHLYSQDDEADIHYKFGIKGTFSPYVDPPMAEALNTLNPLSELSYISYNLIVVVNKFNRHDEWGRGQSMRVYKRDLGYNDGLLYYWLISTGIPGFETDSGYFLPQSFSSRHWSSLYDAPMRATVFFDGGKGLHSSIDRDTLKALGKPASHGCVHIEDNRAEELFHLIGNSGYGSVDIIDKRTGRPLVKNGETVKTLAYKTLIIIH